MRPGAVIKLAFFTWSRLDDHPHFRRYRSVHLAHETLDALVDARKPVRINQILPDTIALRPSDSSTAIISLYASQALTERFPSGSAGIASGPKPVVTSMASFEYISGFEPLESVVTSMAALAWPPRSTKLRFRLQFHSISFVLYALS
jgi:hypothetical protein